MTKSEYRDMLVRISLEGGFPSARKKTAEDQLASLGPSKYICLYRGPNGRKCAAGHQIADDKYDPEMENKTVYVLARDYPGAVSIPEGMTERGLMNCQRAHDRLATDLNGGWDHDRFLRNLDTVEEFADLPRLTT